MFEHLKWKLIERPIFPIGNSYVDAFPFLVLFVFLFISGYALRAKNRKKIRPFVQVFAFIFFIFVVHRCFCTLRGWLFALQEIGRNDLAVFNGLFVFVPLVAFTIIFGRVFCSWICPLGATEEIFYRIPFLKRMLTADSGLAKRQRLLFLVAILGATLFLLLKSKPKTYFFTENTAAFWGIAGILLAFIFVLNPDLHTPLKKIRYLSLALLLIIITLGVFITDPWCAFFSNEIDYSSLVSFFAVVSTAAAVSMAWCRYLCPVGGLLGIVAKSSRTKIKRDKTRELSHEACRNICYVEALGREGLDNSSCLYCGRCVDAGASKIEES